MFQSRKIRSLIPAYILVLCCFLAAGLGFNRAVTTLSESAPLESRYCVIIDAGHGGVDGGATSCTGILESQFNLDISMRINDLLHLLGIKTIMIRTDDRSVYTEGETIAAKKISDLRERTRIVNESSNSVLLSIHMNHYSDSKYYGPQVFYANTENSKVYAEAVQSALNHHLSNGNNRTIKRAEGVYLMQHIHRPGILIECGFLSNREEEARLRDPEYQKEISCVIAITTAGFLSNT